MFLQQPRMEKPNTGYWSGPLNQHHLSKWHLSSKIWPWSIENTQWRICLTWYHRHIFHPGVLKMSLDDCGCCVLVSFDTTSVRCRLLFQLFNDCPVIKTPANSKKTFTLRDVSSAFLINRACFLCPMIKTQRALQIKWSYRYSRLRSCNQGITLSGLESK